MTQVVQAVFIALQMVVAAAVAYLFSLAMAAEVGSTLRRVRKRRVAIGGEAPQVRFLVLIPAHDEERLLGHLLDSVDAADYPAHSIETVVIADNCSDATAEVAARHGARCLERTDPDRPGKGYALDWATRLLAAEPGEWDSFVILDADSVVEREFFTRLDQAYQAHPGILQAHYAVLNQKESSFTAISTLAFALQQYVKPLGRTTLGLSPRLLGNGMAFPARLLADGWGATSISEDLNYFIELLLRGYRTRLVPEAVVFSEMPASRGGARSQRVRWEKGRMLALREQVPRLVFAALRHRDPVLADAAIDIAIPPIAVLATQVVAVAALGLAVPALRPAFSPAAWSVVAGLLVGYVATGVHLVRLPGALVVRSVLAAPLFLVWKLWIQLLAVVGLSDRRWVRTPRSSELEGR